MLHEVRHTLRCFCTPKSMYLAYKVLRTVLLNINIFNHLGRCLLINVSMLTTNKLKNLTSEEETISSLHQFLDKLSINFWWETRIRESIAKFLTSEYQFSSVSFVEDWERIQWNELLCFLMEHRKRRKICIYCTNFSHVLRSNRVS